MKEKLVLGIEVEFDAGCPPDTIRLVDSEGRPIGAIVGLGPFAPVVSFDRRELVAKAIHHRLYAAAWGFSEGAMEESRALADLALETLGLKVGA